MGRFHRTVFVQGDFNGHAKFLFVEGFQQVAIRLGQLCPLQGGIIRVSREEHHRHADLCANRLRCLDSIHLALQPDVHENKVRPVR